MDQVQTLANDKGPLNSHPRPSLALRLLLASGAFALAFGATEIGFRIFSPVKFRQPVARMPDSAWKELLHQPCSIPGLNYELRAGFDKVLDGVHVKTNSLGMRDAEPLKKSTPGLIRIASIGDSFAFGLGVEQEDCYSDVLEQLLNARSVDESSIFDVLNFGVSGYTTRDESLQVQQRVMEFEPDLLILCYVFNDPEVEPKQPLHSYYAETQWWQHSHFLRRIAQKKRRRDVVNYGGGDIPRYLHAYPPKWDTVTEGFERIRSAADEAGIEVLLVLPGWLIQQDWTHYRYHALHAQVRGAAEAQGFHVIDMLEPFSEFDPGDLCLARKDPHPNALGHRLIAEAIADYIEQNQDRLF